MKHIIDTDELDKLLRYWSDGRMCYMIKADELSALIESSPQADGMVLNEQRGTLAVALESLAWADGQLNSKLLKSAIDKVNKAMLSAYKPQADDVRKDAWLPIETAPKDGSYVLGFQNGYGIKTMTWNNQHDGGLGGWRCPNHGWNPTHWMPLPSPPLDKARE